jgi:hypothetical protein
MIAAVSRGSAIRRGALFPAFLFHDSEILDGSSL